MKQATLPLPKTTIGSCRFPLWDNTERAKFRANGQPLMCTRLRDRGDYCAEHADLCYKTKKRAA